MITTAERAGGPRESADVSTTFTAMGSNVTMRILNPGAHAEQAIDAARENFLNIERTCTRFDPMSDLMRANSNGREWTQVSVDCLRVLRRAYAAYRDTDGVFDPRTLESLQALGYDRSWEKVRQGRGSIPTRRRRVTKWRPSFDDARPRVRIGPRPVDLGGIGKGVAVAQAMEILREHGNSILVEAGGDLAVRGTGPNSRGWRVWVEDPFGGDWPAAVCEISDSAVATSSIRRRQWKAGDRHVHHLIDPRTGLPAQSELMSVTVVHAEADTAEVWTKVGFLAGRERIREVFDSAAIPAVWIDEDGRVRYSKAAASHLVWKVSRVQS